MSQYWFISTKYRKGSAKLALITFLLAFVVIILGAYTRLTDAGLSCPDWPHCYGYLVAPHTQTQLQTAIGRFPDNPVNVTKARTEMTHRYFAGTEGILILLLVGSMLFMGKKLDAKRVFVCYGLATLLVVQVLLGMLTVTAKLKPLIVLAHLMAGLSILSLLWWTYLDLNIHEDVYLNKNSARFIPWLWLGLCIVAVQIMLGGWVSTHYAGLACIDFPYCNGELMPKINWGEWQSNLITIHMMHRVGALITAVYLAAAGAYLISSRSFRGIGILLLAIIALQIILGILNIIWLRPVWIALVHHTTAIFILLTLITALAKAYYESRHTRYNTWLA